ncbi:MAG: (Fe-S)-binding protein [Ignavibacteriales bacterium]
MSLNDFRPMMERCSNCLNCKFIPFDKVKSLRFAENCPSICYNNFNTYSARGRFILGTIILDGETDYSDEVTKIVHNCTGCGACDVACKVCRYNLEPLEHNTALKADAVERGKILREQTDMINALKTERTMIPGAVQSKRADWAKGLGLKNLLKDKAEVAFFPGCKYSYDEQLQKITCSAVELLLNAGTDLGILGDADMCCGGRAQQMGFIKEFDERAAANIKAFKASEVSTIVTPCSDCYYTLKRLYAAKGLDVEVLHVVEYIERLISSGKIQLTKSVPLTVTYHDPCHLGRQGEPYIPWEGKEEKILNQIHTWNPKRPRYNGAYGIYDAPRNVLNAIPGLKLVEMERIREYSWCCGAGGGCSETFPEFSSWTAAERIDEANATGAEALVTACPWCESNFRNAVDNNGKRIQVYDIIELVKQAL